MNITNALTDINRQKESILLRIFCPKSDIGMYLTCLRSKIQPYSNTAACTKMIQTKTQVEIDVKDFTSAGELVVMLINKFTRTKNKVISKPILPGTTS